MLNFSFLARLEVAEKFVVGCGGGLGWGGGVGWWWGGGVVGWGGGPGQV